MAKEIYRDLDHALQVTKQMDNLDIRYQAGAAELGEEVGRLRQHVSELEAQGRIPRELPNPDIEHLRAALHLELGVNAVLLTLHERRVYDYLRQHLGSVCLFSDLERAGWGEGKEVSRDALQNTIARIRKKIGDESPYTRLASARDQGYKLLEDSLSALGAALEAEGTQPPKSDLQDYPTPPPEP